MNAGVSHALGALQLRIQTVLQLGKKLTKVQRDRLATAGNCLTAVENLPTASFESIVGRAGVARLLDETTGLTSIKKPFVPNDIANHIAEGNMEEMLLKQLQALAPKFGQLDRDEKVLDPTSIKQLDRATLSSEHPLAQFNGPAFRAELKSDAPGARPGIIVWGLHANPDGKVTLIQQLTGIQDVKGVTEHIAKVMDRNWLVDYAYLTDRDPRFLRVANARWIEDGPGQQINRQNLTNAIDELLGDFGEDLEDMEEENPFSAQAITDRWRNEGVDVEKMKQFRDAINNPSIPPSQWIPPQDLDPRLLEGHRFILALR